MVNGGPLSCQRDGTHPKPPVHATGSRNLLPAGNRWTPRCFAGFVEDKLRSRTASDRDAEATLLPFREVAMRGTTLALPTPGVYRTGPQDGGTVGGRVLDAAKQVVAPAEVVHWPRRGGSRCSCSRDRQCE